MEWGSITDIVVGVGGLGGIGTGVVSFYKMKMQATKLRATIEKEVADRHDVNFWKLVEELQKTVSDLRSQHTALLTQQAALLMQHANAQREAQTATEARERIHREHEALQIKFNEEHERCNARIAALEDQLKNLQQPAVAVEESPND